MVRRKQNSGTKRVVLFIAYLLIQIGSFPVLAVKLLNQLTLLTFRSLSRIDVKWISQLLKLRFPKFSVSLPSLKFKSRISLSPILYTLYSILYTKSRRRGRPRTQPIFSFYISKLQKGFRAAFPKASRFRIIALSLVLILLTYSYLLVRLASSLPSPYQLTQSQNPLTTQIYDREGKLLYQFYEGRNRKLVELDDLPPYLIQAIIAMEDKNFYSHPGIDLGGVLRATIKNFQDPANLQGGSTITQQLVKNTLLTPDKTVTRKVKEIILSLWSEMIYSKKEILQAYLNEAPFGGPAWGIQSAAEMYFDKSAAELSLAESTFLAGLPASPTEYSPYGTHPEKAKDRQKEVLRRMIEDGYLDQNQAQEAYDKPLALKQINQEIKAPHFVMYVRQLLAEKYGERTVSQGGLKIITTLDLNTQELAEAAVGENIKKLQGLRVGNAATMVTEAKTGHILAMVGSKDYFEEGYGNFNVTLALRQPGSSIKPITYASAFKIGYSPGNVLLDSPVTFASSWEKYSPVNYDGKFHGPISIRTALGSSYNIPAVKMLAIVGIPEMIATAKDLGINSLKNPTDYGLSLTLGGGAVRMIDMMSAYNTFATGGIKLQPQPILKVYDSKGNLLEDHQNPSGKRVLTEEIAYLITSILSDRKARVPAFGVNSLLEIAGHSNVAVKTGTSDDKRDNWTFGYSPEYVVGAWVGNNDNSPMDPRLTSGITGATPIWHDIMNELISDRVDMAFKRPKGITETIVDGNKDIAISGNTPKSIVSTLKTKKKDETSGQDKEIITYTDPFSKFTPDTKATQ